MCTINNPKSVQYLDNYLCGCIWRHFLTLINHLTYQIDLDIKARQQLIIRDNSNYIKPWNSED